MQFLLGFITIGGIILITNHVIADTSEVTNIEEERIRSTIQKEIEGVTYISSNPKLRQDISNLIFNPKSTSGKYDMKNRPEGTLNASGPVIVTVSTFIQNIDKISDTDMEFNLRFIFRESWIDNRLVYGKEQKVDENVKEKPRLKFILLTEDEINKIWTPDLYFPNEKEGALQSVIKPVSYTRVYPHGLVLQSSKLIVKFSCDMPVEKFPLDRQKCPIRITSYGWQKGEFELVWNTINPVDLRPEETNLPYHTISPFDRDADLVKNCTNSTSTGEYSCLVLWLRFSRKFGIYLMQLYLPSAILVVMSWTPFWVDPEEGKDSRFAILIGVTLCLITQTSVSTKDSPPTAYVKGSDWWIGFCQFLVFMAFLENIYVNFLMQSGSLFPEIKIVSCFGFGCKKKQSSPQSIAMISTGGPPNPNEDKFPEGRFAKWVDRGSRIVFPCVFILFNCLYWPIMTS